jgi:hypothetical protein
VRCRSGRAVPLVFLFVAAVALGLVMGTGTAAAHPGSVALWRVTVSGDEVRSQILVSLLDFGWTAHDLPTTDKDGALTDGRRRAIAREVLDHFVVLEDGQPTEGRVVRTAILPTGALEVIATHPMSGSDVSLALQATFHELTDESHRVLARVEYRHTSHVLMFTADTSQHLLPDAGPTPWYRALARDGTRGAMLLLGIEHIVTGWDHLVFLLCLLLPGGTLRSRVAMVTAFTVAHSLTLLLAATHVVVPPERFVEAAIAVTVAYVAIENLVRDGPRSRWPIAFGFGLIHGFGFAGMLDVLDLPMGQFASFVIAFNVGVEIGQLAVVALAAPLIARSARHRWHRTFVQSSSLAVCGLAAFWLVERLS